MDLPFPSRENAPGAAPLAERVRPGTLSDFVGQADIVGEGTLLRRSIENGTLTQSMILWGPPGCGKTTLARLIAGQVRNRFVPFSAVTSGIADVKRVIADAEKLVKIEGLPLLMFVDEIHRFNRAQQDAFLPHIESGTIVFIGATTENPSFEVIGPLLSRSRVFVLEALAKDDVIRILRRAQEGGGPTLAALDLNNEVLAYIADQAQGDARVALNALDYLASVLGGSHGASGDAAARGTQGTRAVTPEMARDALQSRTISTDKSGESHYNLISALHKSLRGGDADASLYWLARMCEAGEDPMYIARRLVRFASEDIGNADRHALPLAVACRDAVAFTGYPECKLALAQCVIFLALAPKSNSVYRAYQAAAEAVRNNPPHPVPLHIRNAPTRLMKDLGYGAGYQYPPDAPEASPQDFLPEALADARFYRPTEAGFEAEMTRRLDEWRSRKPSKPRKSR